MKKKKIKEMLKESTKIHKIWHSFCTYMGREYSEVGYEAMCKARKFAKKHPEILIIDCDDNHHASSDIFLIPHEGNKGYWGTTMFFIPQCTDEQNIICLYPNHLNCLIKALQELQERQRKNPYEQT